MTRRKKNEPKLTRREEFYQFLVGTMLSKSLGGPNHEEYMEYEKKQGFTYFSREFKKGDIILTQGSLYGNHNPWCIGVCETKHSENEVVIRDIFSGMLCNYGNESYVSVHNVPFRYTLNDKDYKLYRQFVNAIRAVDEWQFDFRVCDAKPARGGVMFYTRRKWKDYTGQKHFIKYRTRSSEMRERLTKILQQRKEEREEAKADKAE